MARKYREVTYQEPVGRGFWGWVKIFGLVILVIIAVAAIL